jgi:hypothetical protein
MYDSLFGQNRQGEMKKWLACCCELQAPSRVWLRDKKVREFQRSFKTGWWFQTSSIPSNLSTFQLEKV